MHVEVVTNIIPTMNDDDEQLSGIAGWIEPELGELTPWHVTRFYPHRHFATSRPRRSPPWSGPSPSAARQGCASSTPATSPATPARIRPATRVVNWS